MNREICNPSHFAQITHIDTLSDILVCAQDFSIFQSSGSHLIPIMDYANDSAELLNEMNKNAQALLINVENKLNLTSNTHPVIEKIERAFQAYFSYIESIKQKLLSKMQKPSSDSDQSIANNLCSLAEEISLKNINLKKAIINKDYLEIRRNALKKCISELNSKYNYFEQSFSQDQNIQPQGF